MEYTNSQIRELIAEHIHSERDRGILSSRLIDGMTFEQIGFEMGMTTKTVRVRIHKQESILFSHLPG